jgi:hypothetical protein
MTDPAPLQVIRRRYVRSRGQAVEVITRVWDRAAAGSCRRCPVCYARPLTTVRVERVPPAGVDQPLLCVVVEGVPADPRLEGVALDASTVG